MSRIIITALAAQRRQLEVGHSSLVLLVEEMNRNIRRIAEFTGGRRLRCIFHSLGSEAAQAVAHSCSSSLVHSAMIFGNDIGRGYDGHGDQASTPSRIENYMGFATGISGAFPVWRCAIQAMMVGTRFAIRFGWTGSRARGRLFLRHLQRAGCPVQRRSRQDRAAVSPFTHRPARGFRGHRDLLRRDRERMRFCQDSEVAVGIATAIRSTCALPVCDPMPPCARLER